MALRLKKSDTEIKHTLSRKGVPSPVINYVMEETDTPQAYEMLTWLVVFLAFSGVYIGVVFLWPFMVELSKTAALNHAQKTPAILFDYNFGPALILGMLAWVFICLSVPSILVTAKPKLQKSIFSRLLLDPFNGIVARHFLKKTNTDFKQTPLSVDGYVKNFFNKLTSFIEWQAILLSLASATFMYLEFQAHTLIMPDGVKQANILPWVRPKTQFFADASYVELGCNYIDEEMSHLNYTIHFKNGPSVDLGASFPVKGKWIDQAEAINGVLLANNTQFRRWEWPGRTALHPKCIERYSAEFGVEGNARLHSLLQTSRLHNE
ncbi:hypothetical protein [Hirschia litorea]|uniref:Uncharacterized protein n=1 Tax=Hirschia litorea TaxID=1199156 RepID=A0ABW2IJT9_9PROT